MQDIYVNPFTEFGFKKLFAREEHKELLISVLNTLLPEKHQIEYLQYAHDEQWGFDSAFVYVTLPNFKKTLDELETNQDKWLYIFQHLHDMDEIPEALEEQIFLIMWRMPRGKQVLRQD